MICLFRISQETLPLALFLKLLNYLLKYMKKKIEIRDSISIEILSNQSNNSAYSKFWIKETNFLFLIKKFEHHFTCSFSFGTGIAFKGRSSSIQNKLPSQRFHSLVMAIMLIIFLCINYFLVKINQFFSW